MDSGTNASGSVPGSAIQLQELGGGSLSLLAYL